LTVPRRDRSIKVEDRTLSGLERVARRDGVTMDELAERWLREKLDDDMRRRLLEAAGGNKPDPAVIFDTTCAVTMFDMHAQLSSDGRERGLWIWLRDRSPDRVRQHQELLELEKKGLHRFDGTVNEAALLEWPAVRAFHAAMGKALKGRK
jgi:hypothetical protein